MKTSTGRTIEATANYQKRTFTIRCTETDGTKTKYRTVPMSREEFESNEFNTSNDWQQFLNSTNDYYIA
jgi:hypothetical protein